MNSIEEIAGLRLFKETNERETSKRTEAMNEKLSIARLRIEEMTKEQEKLLIELDDAHTSSKIEIESTRKRKRTKRVYETERLRWRRKTRDGRERRKSGKRR